MRAIDPIFVAPRPVQRDWGRTDLGDWLKAQRTPGEPVAEAWALDPANETDAGPFGRRVMRQVSGMLGDIGRAPPKVRLVFPGKSTRLKSTSPLSFWTILEPGIASLTDPEETVHRAGERIRAYEGAEVPLAAGSVALEVSSSFLPTNDGKSHPQLVRLPPVSARTRATLFRHTGLSVEAWSLPEWSRVVPDGETCHVLMTLGPGVRIDGRNLEQGATVFVPACGRPLDISAAGRGAKLLVAYPDLAPTDVWRHTPGPDPSSGQLPKPEPAQPPLQAVSPIPAMAA